MLISSVKNDLAKHTYLPPTSDNPTGRHHWWGQANHVEYMNNIQSVKVSCHQKLPTSSSRAQPCTSSNTFGSSFHLISSDKKKFHFYTPQNISLIVNFMSMILFRMLLYHFLIVILRYNSHAIKSIYWKCKI